ncbi:MAG: hypothetical protein M1832_001514 [Thelocarpon impressellum]|nr:MAG: hypothetical protein M1832_001514 [Thelocarpon impressellum]
MQEQTPDSDAESNDQMEKDAAEEELERAVFGDDAGFREGLKAHTAGAYEASDAGNGEQEDEEDGELDGVDDADLFFIDSGPTPLDSNALVVASAAPEDYDETLRAGEAPAWEDSDDERLMVSLAGGARLRKLRVSAAEDMVNGKEYTKRLRRQFERLYPVPDWALPSGRNPPTKRRASEANNSSADDMDVDEELSVQPLAKLLQSTESLTRGSSGKRGTLRAEVLDIQRTKDIPGTQPSAINSLEFHPLYPVLLSSGPASTIYLHHIDPSAIPPNPLLTSLHIRSTPLTTTVFHPSGDRIYLSGRRRYYHAWTLSTGEITKVTRVYGHQSEQRSMERFRLSPCGRYLGLIGSSRKAGSGTINILDAHTSQWLAAARVDSPGGIADFAWWRSGDGLTAAGRAGDILEYSVADRRAVATWHDAGGVGTTTIALGGAGGPPGLGGDRWVALGSTSGIVNIYDRRAWPSLTSSSALPVPAQPTPTRSLDQLTTPTSALAFSPDGQLLAMSSRWKRDALRLVHLPSCAVYRNWPTAATPLGRVSAVAWAPDSGWLAVANEAGKIRLWEIRA